jgi:hypothetical protein
MQPFNCISLIIHSAKERPWQTFLTFYQFAEKIWPPCCIGSWVQLTFVQISVIEDGEIVIQKSISMHMFSMFFFYLHVT